MKNLIIIISLLVISSCSATKKAQSGKVEDRREKKLALQVRIKEAVESRRYIIKLDRLYFSYGRITDLKPRVNFIIIDGEKAVIRAGYLGRAYDMKPIAGINMRGRAIEYELTDNSSKGSYYIKLKVDNGANSFDVHLSISKNGHCSASVSSLKIDNVRYSGYLVPILDKSNEPIPEGYPMRGVMM